MCADNVPTNSPGHLSNGAIAAELMARAQFLAASGGNRFKVKAYRRAAGPSERWKNFDPEPLIMA